METRALAAVGRYTVERLLGAGATGSVLLAFDTRLQRRVALKVLGAGAPEIGADAVALSLREARAASAISHPNAMAVFDVDEADGRAFIVMEYVPGTPLRRFVGDGSVPLATRLRWLIEIAGALAAAHAVGVVHRDVKPDNVMVREDGVVKVLDFGVARVAPRDDPAAAAPAGFTTWTEAGGFVGTPGYMAPEVLRGQPIDGRADQFGWGVLAYELLAGRLPWRGGDTPFGLIASVLTEPPEPLGPEVPPEVAAAVLRAIAKAPEDRFPSLSEAAAAITPFAEQAASSILAPATSQVRATAAPPSPAPPPPTPLPVPPSPAPAMAVGATLRSVAHAAPRPASSAPPPAGPAPAPGFRAPDFAAPVDLEEHLALLPPRATCKGMFFADLFAAVAKVRTPGELSRIAGVPERRYVAFRDYPMGDNLRLAVVVARTLYPRLPLGEGLRRVGLRALDVVLSSHVGRTILGVLGRDPEPFFLSSATAYRLLVSFGEVSAERVGPGEIKVRMRGLPIFLETIHVGILESVLHHCRVRGRVWIDLEALDRAAFLVQIG